MVGLRSSPRRSWSCTGPSRRVPRGLHRRARTKCSRPLCHRKAAEDLSAIRRTRRLMPYSDLARSIVKGCRSTHMVEGLEPKETTEVASILCSVRGITISTYSYTRSWVRGLYSMYAHSPHQQLAYTAVDHSSSNMAYRLKLATKMVATE